MLNITTTPGLISELSRIKSKTLEYKALVSKLENELQESELVKRINKGKDLLKELNCEEISLKNKGIEILQNAGIKDFTSNGIKVSIKESPGKLIVEDEEKIPAEYKKEKTTITVDKKTLKEDMKEGVIIEGVRIDKDISLVIKYS